MNEIIDKYLSPLKKYLSRYVEFFAVHKAVLVALVAAVAIVAALYQSNSYLETTRDETTYQDEILKVNYNSIDPELVEQISATLDDANIEVDSQLVPGRTNPFNE